MRTPTATTTQAHRYAVVQIPAPKRTSDQLAALDEMEARRALDLTMRLARNNARLSRLERTMLVLRYEMPDVQRRARIEPTKYRLGEVRRCEELQAICEAVHWRACEYDRTLQAQLRTFLPFKTIRSLVLH